METTKTEKIYEDNSVKFGMISLVVGGQGTGKTTFVKNMLPEKRKTFIFDVNGEYENSEYVMSLKGTDIKIFLRDIKHIKGVNIVLEECTAFLNNRMYNNDITEMLIAKRHNNFNIYLIFHSLRSIPAYLYDISDYLILFKTKDNSELVKRKYGLDSNMFKQYLYLKKHKDEHRYICLDLRDL